MSYPQPPTVSADMNAYEAPPATSSARHERTVTERLRALHDMARNRFSFIDRIAIAVYDRASDNLKTFASSNIDGEPLQAYEVRLSHTPSLLAIANAHCPRVVDDIDAAFTTDTEHTRWLRRQGFRSSFTIPIYFGNALAGFLFFDSRKQAAFKPDVTEFLDVFAEFAAQLYLLRLTAARGLLGTVHLASRIASIRDVETGMHLERMAKYSRVIALNLRYSGHHLDDEFIEYIHTFASLHDIGKIGVPDRILMKAEPLDEAEWLIMRQHVDIGTKMVDDIVADLGLVDDEAATVMRNIVWTHHERCDGSGYPRGLTLDEIPLEGRIVAVADVFDALTNRRPYKEPWTNQRAIESLEQYASARFLDPDCVSALLHDRDALERIQHLFADRAVD